MLAYFRWLEEGVIAGSEMPKPGDIQWLYHQGIRAIISFEKLREEVLREINRLGIEHFTIPIEDYGIPSRQDLEDFFAMVKRQKERHSPILIHCAGGVGRTGTIGALYLIKEKKMSWQNAMSIVGHVDSGKQEQFIIQFANEFALRRSGIL